jgi:hypothetical protein
MKTSYKKLGICQINEVFHILDLFVRIHGRGYGILGDRGCRGSGNPRIEANKGELMRGKEESALECGSLLLP